MSRSRSTQYLRILIALSLVINLGSQALSRASEDGASPAPSSDETPYARAIIYGSKAMAYGKLYSWYQTQILGIDQELKNANNDDTDPDLSEFLKATKADLAQRAKEAYAQYDRLARIYDSSAKAYDSLLQDTDAARICNDSYRKLNDVRDILGGLPSGIVGERMIQVNLLENQIQAQLSYNDSKPLLKKAIQHVIDLETAELKALGEDLDYLKSHPIEGQESAPDVVRYKKELAMKNARIDRSKKAIAEFKQALLSLRSANPGFGITTARAEQLLKMYERPRLKMQVMLNQEAREPQSCLHSPQVVDANPADRSPDPGAAGLAPPSSASPENSAAGTLQ